MTLADVINQIKDGEIYEATYALNMHWYITKLVGCIWYCDENGEIIQDIPAIPLTRSNLRAEYKLV
jgi:hypothetical protein